MGYHASGGFCCARLSCKLSERSYLFAELDTHGAEEALVDLCSVGLDIEPIHIRRRLAFDCAKVAAAREFISIDRLQTDRDADLADVDRERNTRDHLVNCICGQIDFDPAEGRALLEECAELSIEQTSVNSSCDIREDIEEGVDHVALELAYQVGDGQHPQLHNHGPLDPRGNGYTHDRQLCRRISQLPRHIYLPACFQPAYGAHSSRCGGALIRLHDDNISLQPCQFPRRGAGEQRHDRSGHRICKGPCGGQILR